MSVEIAKTERWPRLWHSDLPYRFILVSDLDHTMVQNEDATHAHLLAFDAAWAGGLGLPSALVYSTGRSPELYRKLWHEAPLLTPQVLICSVGSEIFMLCKEEACADGRGGALVYRPHAEWAVHLDGGGWDRSKVVAAAGRFPQLKPQAESEQRPHKVSFRIEGGADAARAVLAELEGALKEACVPAKVIYSGGSDVDILSERAGKGMALRFVLDSLEAKGHGWPEAGVQVNGDSGNDAELFEVPHVVGCVVVNAHPELRSFAEARTADPGLFQATLPCAGGIAEAMAHFGTRAAFAAAPHDTARAAAAVTALADFLTGAVRVSAGAPAAVAVLLASALPPALAACARPTGISVALHDGVALEQTAAAQEAGPGAAVGAGTVRVGSWVDLLELLLWPASGTESGASSASAGRSVFLVHTLGVDGRRDVARALHCEAELGSADGTVAAVSVRRAHPDTDFALP